MNRVLTLTLTVLLFCGPLADAKRSTRKSARKTTKAKTEYVYICTGPNAYAYHSSPDCSGLNRCSSSVKKVSRSSVSHRKPCMKCH